MNKWVIIYKMTTTGIEYGSYMPWIGTAVAVGYAVYLTLKTRAEKGEKADQCINKCHQKDNSKVVDTFDIEDMSNKTVFCRCWQSEKVFIHMIAILQQFHNNFIKLYNYFISILSHFIL